jgi:hypothetical protein
MVLLDPDPVVVTRPGIRVIVQFPEGKPLSTTVPVSVVQFGCVIVPTVGADGDAGAALITTLADKPEAHPALLVALKL